MGEYMKDYVVKVENATVRFNMATENIDNLKEYFVKLVQGKLMFQEFLALKDISFEIKRGEAWGIIGTNGSGKSGMQARLGFAVATMVRPDILIVDEILAVGDYKFTQKCQARMREMLDSGTTLLLVSHSIDDVKTMCNHAIWIDKGNMMMQGDAQEVCDAYMKAQQ